LETYPMSFNIFFRLLGTNLMPQEHRRKTESNEHNSINQSDELHNQIRRLNQLDVAVYEHFSRLLELRATEWAQMQDVRVPVGCEENDLVQAQNLK
jgi:hypothetical protein